MIRFHLLFLQRSKINTAIICVCTFLFLSCTKNISKEQAKSMIDEYKTKQTGGWCASVNILKALPSEEYSEGFCICLTSNSSVSNDDKNKIDRAIVKQLVKIDTSYEFDGCCRFTHYTTMVLPQYSSYILPQEKENKNSLDLFDNNASYYKIKFVDFEVNEIKDIQYLNDKSAIVQYTIRAKSFTPFSQLFDAPNCNINFNKTMSINFVKYDDGWHVQYMQK